MLLLQHRLSLDPEISPEPPIPLGNSSRLDSIALRLVAVAAIAVLGGWAAIVVPAKLSRTSLVHNASLLAGTPVPVKAVKAVHVRTAAQTPMRPPMQTLAVQAVPQMPIVLSAGLSVGDPSRPQEARSTVAELQVRELKGARKSLVLSADEIAMLVERGKDDLTNGDFSSARLLLRRAADAGSAEAALALGSTFDPRVIKRLGAVGVRADAMKARQWYEKAEQLGSSAAAGELARLAGAGG